MTERATDQLLTLREVVALTGHSINTGYGWRTRGVGPRLFKRNGRIVAWRGDVLAWMAAREQNSATGGIN